MTQGRMGGSSTKQPACQPRGKGVGRCEQGLPELSPWGFHSDPAKPKGQVRGKKPEAAQQQTQGPGMNWQEAEAPLMQPSFSRHLRGWARGCQAPAGTARSWELDAQPPTDVHPASTHHSRVLRVPFRTRRAADPDPLPSPYPPPGLHTRSPGGRELGARSCWMSARGSLNQRIV